MYIKKSLQLTKSFLLQNRVVLFSSLLYFCITLPAFFQKNHVLYNLEPYPDGLLYVNSVKNFVETGKFALRYNGTFLSIWTPFFYSLSLVPFYLLTQNPIFFYLANITFGLVSLLLIAQLVKENSGHLAAFFAGLLWLSHSYLLWLPSVPMSENLSLLLFVLALYLLNKKASVKNSLALFATAGVLFLTRYALLGSAGILILLALYRLSKQIKLSKTQLILLTSAFCLLPIALLLSNKFVLAMFKEAFVQLSKPNSQFYGFRFITTNLTYYLNSLLGIKQNLLWLTTSITTLPVLLIALFSVIGNRKKSMNNFFQLILFSLASFVPLIIFYAQDVRYGIFVLPVIVILAGAAISNIQQSAIKNEKLKIILNYSLIIFSLTFSVYHYLPITKLVIANNLLGRSTAWQQQSLYHFNNYFREAKIENPILITALPPYLSTWYQDANYRLLPLSKYQEFLSKRQKIWGKNINYYDLRGYFEKIVYSIEYSATNETLFISNAYITHNSRVKADYEKIKEEFELELVSEGCKGACDIYLLNKEEIPDLIWDPY